MTLTNLTKPELQALWRQYDELFGDLDEFNLPQIIFDARYVRLLEKAIATRQRLTREQIDAVIPDVAWNY